MKNKIKEHYPFGGMVVITVLMLVGLVLLYFSGITEISNYDDFYNVFSSSGMIIIFSSFFLFIGLYCYISFFKNVILKPKEDILLLKDHNDYFYTFIDRKGKKYVYYDEKLKNTINVQDNNYYIVLKSCDYILEVKNISSLSFKEQKPKKSYWLNLYTPYGNFENIFLLPIIYVILLPGLFSYLMSKGAEKIFGLLFMGYPVYLIIYDLVYKIKNK